LSEPIENISSSEAASFLASHEIIAKIICIAASQLHHITRDLIFSRRFQILMKVYYYRFYYRNFCFVIFWMTLLSKHRLALSFSWVLCRTVETWMFLGTSNWKFPTLNTITFLKPHMQINQSSSHNKTIYFICRSH
jgi:hypothetical protein